VAADALPRRPRLAGADVVTPADAGAGSIRPGPHLTPSGRHASSVAFVACWSAIVAFCAATWLMVITALF
jgi:hypothetical protein